jgi:hypothetical protein
MIKTKDGDTSALKLQEFAAHNSKMFHDKTLPQEEYMPLATPAT